MKILYCSWGEVTRVDAYQALTDMQHQVGLLDYEIKDYNRDAVFSRFYTVDSKAGSCGENQIRKLDL